MGFPRPVACLAAHVDFRKGGLVGPGSQVEIALQVGGVAIRAHVIPVHAVAGPVEPVRRIDAFVFCEREPPFALRIPGDRERLQAPVFQRDEILLERFVAEGIGDGIALHGSVGSLRMDEEAAVFPEKARFDAAVTKHGVVEIAEYGFREGLFHSPVVIRAFPREGDFRMAPGTDFAAHIPRGGSGRGCTVRAAPGPDKNNQADQTNQTNPVNKPARRREFAIGTPPPDHAGSAERPNEHPPDRVGSAVSTGGPNEHPPDKARGNEPPHEKRTRIFGGHRRFRDARYTYSILYGISKYTVEYTIRRGFMSGRPLSRTRPLERIKRFYVVSCARINVQFLLTLSAG